MLMRSLAVFLLSQLLVAAQDAGTGKTFQQIWTEDFDPCWNGASCVNGLRTSVWSLEEGDGSRYGPDFTGWGNGELQCYTNASRNVRVLQQAGGALGVLSIDATFHEDGMSCTNPGAASSTRYWSSGRIASRAKLAFAFEQNSSIKYQARVKVPRELGAWPAFWLLPNTYRTDCVGCGDLGGWCTSGEVDILEARNRDGLFQSTIHYGGRKAASWEGCRDTAGVFNASSFTAYWNRVSVVMGSSGISFYVNDTLVQSIPSSTWYTAAVDKADDPLAPFNRPFYMLLNLAVGGRYPAETTGGHVVTDTRRAPYRYLVDWVRVYKEVPI